ncbi:LamG domain-containing protein [Bremerella cremea]|uniref:LamG domain-containing protein n=1 Tax=Bremerella cremea TaxID=1031537 RepID=UPI0031EA72D8
MTNPRFQPKKIRRDGFAIVIVLALLSVTLALSYSMMRVQSTTHQIQSNMSRQADARQAAISGISAGVREMYESDWAGIDATLAMSLGSHRSYAVRYETGDPWLQPGDSDYAEKPFRVTVISTGYAFDPVSPTVRSQYTIRAVVQLVRRKLQTNPSSYQAATGHSLYSYGTGDSHLELPNRVHGKSFINGTLNLCEDWQKTNRPFSGLIDEIVIHNRAMSGLEVYTINLIGNLSSSSMASVLSSYGIRHWWRFNESDSTATVAIDSVGGRHGTYRGGVVPGYDVGGGNKAVYLDGVSGRIDLGGFDLPSNTDFTINAWIAPTSMTGTNEDARIISKASGTDSNDHWWMLSTTLRGANAYPRIRLKTTSDQYEKIPSNGKIYANRWILLTVTFNSSENSLKIYINGVQADSWKVYGDARSTSSVLTWIGDNPPGTARSRYLEDIALLAAASDEDYRPMAGEVTLSSDRNDISTALTLNRQLNCTTNYQATSASAPSNTTGGTGYRLFPGGKEYTIPLVSSSLQDETLSPDIDTNPLGIFRVQGSVTLQNNVNIEGTLIAQYHGSDIHLRGSNVMVKGVDLPALDGDETRYQLPTLIANDDIDAAQGTQVQIDGAIAAFGDFEVEPLYSNGQVQIAGQVFADEFKLEAGSDWSSLAYYSYYYFINFVNAVGQTNTSANFATWLDDIWVGRLIDKVKIKLPDEVPTYQWLDPGQPIYQVGDGDVGLVWELVRWQDDGGR